MLSVCEYQVNYDKATYWQANCSSYIHISTAIRADQDLKDKLYENLIFLVSKVSENQLFMIGGDLNRYVGKDASGYDRIHGDFGYGV